MNTVQLIGRLTKDVEMRYTASGKVVGSFTLAVDRRVTGQNGERETDFINCVIWNKPAETLSQYTRKGVRVGVEGRLQVRHYENQQGNRVYVTEVIVQNFDLLERLENVQQQPTATGQGYPQRSYGTPISIPDDDLPF